jgi:anaphase-promoting complex subunit 5
MARYLTPAKVGLLALIELYAENAVPSDAVLTVLSFVTSHLLDHVSSNSPKATDTPWSKAERTVRLVVSIRDFEKLLGGLPLLTGLPGRRLWDHFVAKLWDINSLDALHVFFENLSSMLVKSKEEQKRLEEQGLEEPPNTLKFSATSPFGAFIRRCRIEFQRLRFQDCTELWKDFVRYRHPTAAYQKRRKGKDVAFGDFSFDNVLFVGEQVEWDPESVSALTAVTYGDMFTGDERSTLPVSTDDIEALLDFQIDRMQSKLTPLHDDPLSLLIHRIRIWKQSSYRDPQPVPRFIARQLPCSKPHSLSQVRDAGTLWWMNFSNMSQFPGFVASW